MDPNNLPNDENKTTNSPAENPSAPDVQPSPTQATTEPATLQDAIAQLNEPPVEQTLQPDPASVPNVPTLIQPDEKSTPSATQNPIFQPPTPEPLAPAQESVNPFVLPGASTIPEPNNQSTDQIQPTDQTNVPPPKNRKKLFILLGAGSALFFGLVIAFVFGWYLPNTPSSVWSAGLDRSGKALQKITADSTTKESIESVQKSELTIDGEVKTGDATYSGNLGIKTDSSNSEGSAKVTLKPANQTAKDITLNFKTNTNPANIFPALYFKVSGIKNILGGSALGSSSMNSILAYDSKWISAEQSDFEKLGLTPEELKEQKDSEFTAEEIAEVAEVVTSTINEYVLTSDTSKGIITQKEFLGGEKLGDINTYKYAIEINKDNARVMCETLVDRVTKTAIYKKIAKESASSEEIDEAKKDCADWAKDITNKDPMVLWMDRKTKLIHKIRVTEEKEAGNWVEISQNYSGGDSIEFAVKYNSDKEKAVVTGNFSINTKTQSTSGSIEGKGGSSSDSYTFKLNMKSKPYTGSIDSTKPAGAISLTTLMNSFRR